MTDISVIIPSFNAADTLGACLAALEGQNLSRGQFEIIVVDDGSTDATSEIAARYRTRIIRQQNRGAPAARNAGIAAATGKWVAFTDADCVPSRGWLRALSSGAAKEGVIGAAGPIIGMPSGSSASRFVDISGGLDVERHLSHPLYPFAPSGNVMYLREALERVGGFDERYAAYDSCDLNLRIKDTMGGDLVFVKGAVVLHKHRDSWKAYWRQQVNYGRGLAQFYTRWDSRIRWSLLREASAWIALVPKAAASCLPGSDEAMLARRGDLVKTLAQRIGFAATYFSGAEKSRWTP